jgi:single-stranded DNA-binding protein
MDFNEVFIEGRLLNDAVLSDGDTSVVAKFTLVCNEDVRFGGAWSKRAQYVPIAIHGNYAKSLLPVLVKSARCIVLGKLESYEGRFQINALKVRIYEGTRKEKEEAGK